MKEKFLLKDHLFNVGKVTYLAGLISAVQPSFKAKIFIKEVMGRFPELELKARIVWIAEVLGRHLPTDFTKASVIIVNALPPPLDINKSDDDFGDFIFAPLGEYVVQNGLTQQHLAQSLCTLREITQRFSMEDSLRYFLNVFPVETLAMCDTWVHDKNYHVRRLVSESTRPHLPWSKKINIDYTVAIKYLEILYTDTTRYVTRSVANHLNDISKLDSRLVVSTLQCWRQSSLQTKKELTWLTKHALRTLVKKGDPAALSVLGFEQSTGVVVTDLKITSVRDQVTRGDTFTFMFEVIAKEDSNLLMDYCIDFVKASGSSKPKIFKLKALQLPAGESVTISKKHYLKADATTFKLYPGIHMLSILINGQKLANLPFEVT